MLYGVFRLLTNMLSAQNTQTNHWSYDEGAMSHLTLQAYLPSDYPNPCPQGWINDQGGSISSPLLFLPSHLSLPSWRPSIFFLFFRLQEEEFAYKLASVVTIKRQHDRVQLFTPEVKKNGKKTSLNIRYQQ